MTTKAILGKTVQVVTLLFAAFSGFLKTIAPPEPRAAPFAVGLSSFLALVVLLFVVALAEDKQNKRSRKAWLRVAGTLFASTIIVGLIYRISILALTFEYPPDNPQGVYLGGISMKPAARSDMFKSQDNKAILVADYGGLGNRNLIWTDESINEAAMLLLVEYVLFVVALAATVFCLTEGLLRHPSRGERSVASAGSSGERRTSHDRDDRATGTQPSNR